MKGKSLIIAAVLSAATIVGSISGVLPAVGNTITVEAAETKTVDAKFTDVNPSSYSYKAIYWALSEGVTTGTSDTMFSPNKPCTRAEMVTFLWNLNGKYPSTAVTGFTDVPANAYYSTAVAWAKAAGVTDGTSANTFSPNQICTRGQMAAFLSRYVYNCRMYLELGNPMTAGTDSGFSDVDPSAYYAQAVTWAKNSGVASGTSFSTYSPNQACTRGQMAMLLWNMAGKPDINIKNSSAAKTTSNQTALSVGKYEVSDKPLLSGQTTTTNRTMGNSASNNTSLPTIDPAAASNGYYNKYYDISYTLFYNHKAYPIATTDQATYGEILLKCYPELQSFKNDLSNCSTDFAKLVAMSRWLYTNGFYYETSRTNSYTVPDFFTTKGGQCPEFALLGYGMGCISGIPVVMIQKESGVHTWNEFYCDGEWLNIDFTPSISSKTLAYVKAFSGADYGQNRIEDNPLKNVPIITSSYGGPKVDVSSYTANLGSGISDGIKEYGFLYLNKWIAVTTPIYNYSTHSIEWTDIDDDSYSIPLSIIGYNG